MANDFSNDIYCKALWRFENGALTVDSIGSNALTNNGITANTSDYKEGNASAEGDGNSYLVIVDADLDSGFPLKNGDTNKKISIAGWFKLDNNSTRTLISKGDLSVPNFSIQVMYDSGKIQFWQGIGSGGSAVLLHQYAIQTGRFYHLGITYQDSDKSWKFRLWDDTASSVIDNSSGTALNNIFIGSGDLYLGAEWDDFASSVIRRWIGKWDEFVFFNDILTIDEIDAIRQSQYSVGETPLSFSQSVDNDLLQYLALIYQETLNSIFTIISYTLQESLNSFIKTLGLKKSWEGNAQECINSILSVLSLSQEARNGILELTPIGINQTAIFSLPETPELTALAVQYMILLDNADVTGKVKSCRISYSREKFTAEVSIIWQDWSLYGIVDCSDIARNYRLERLEILTRLSATDLWTSQGKFFLERRDTRATPDEILPTSWGRNRPAILGEPYAKPLTKTWNVDTTAKGIAEEVIAGLATLEWDIMDYPVRAGKFSADKERPIRILNRLSSAIGGIVTTDKAGNVKVGYRWRI